MKILPLDPIIPIVPIIPVKRKKQQKTRGKRRDTISDENLGRNVDITVKGPLNAPDCSKCVSYYVTWDSDFPHGCKIFKFKKAYGSLSLSVYEATGCHCQFFEENQKIVNKYKVTE